MQGAERHPRENDVDERRLGEDLLQASLLAPAAAASAVLATEARHASRRETLWARMGRAPLAQAVKHQADVARAFAEPLVGGSASEMPQSYADSGWRVDAAARAAMAIAQQEQLDFDAAKSGAKTGVASLIALCSALLRKSVRGGLVVVGELTLGGSIEPIHHAVILAGMAVEKGARALLLPVSCRRQLFDLSDDMATRLDIEFYQDAKDALLKSLAD